MLWAKRCPGPTRALIPKEPLGPNAPWAHMGPGPKRMLGPTGLRQMCPNEPGLTIRFYANSFTTNIVEHLLNKLCAGRSMGKGFLCFARNLRKDETPFVKLFHA